MTSCMCVCVGGGGGGRHLADTRVPLCYYYIFVEELARILSVGVANSGHCLQSQHFPIHLQKRKAR